ncbi:MAG: hypothetical protein A2Y15_07420 [Clostridiales bacterium GWF2_36_10]|nr:MAG: hypothetical protein A2Y15_07420 [Clostridiales bacterium GWF2_36_10]
MRVTKKIISLFLCLSMVFTFFAVSIPQETDARTLGQVEADLKECENLLVSLQNQKASLGNEINDLDKQSNVTADQLGVYIRQIETIEVEIALTESTIETFEIKLSELAANVLIQEENLVYYQDLFSSLILYSFKQEDDSYFEILLDSKNFSDFLTRVDNLKYFLDYTDSVMDSLKLTMNDLETARANHENAIGALDTYKSDLIDKNNELVNIKTGLDKKAAEIGASVGELTDKYSNTDNLIAQTKAKIASLKKERDELINSETNYRWPIKSGNSWYVSSWFGWRTDPFTGRADIHNGLDIAAAGGVPIVASKSGTVTRSEYAGGFGNVVVIYHGDGYSTLYAHCSSLVAKVGDNVKQGEVIAYVGTTGRSTGNHLHFSVIKNGSYVNPDSYLPNVYPKKNNKI